MHVIMYIFIMHDLQYWSTCYEDVYGIFFVHDVNFVDYMIQVLLDLNKVVSSHYVET